LVAALACQHDSLAIQEVEAQTGAARQQFADIRSKAEEPPGGRIWGSPDSSVSTPSSVGSTWSSKSLECEELASKLRARQAKLEEYQVYRQVMDLAIERLRSDIKETRTDSEALKQRIKSKPKAQQAHQKAAVKAQKELRAALKAMDKAEKLQSYIKEETVSMLEGAALDVAYKREQLVTLNHEIGRMKQQHKRDATSIKDQQHKRDAASNKALARQRSDAHSALQGDAHSTLQGERKAAIARVSAARHILQDAEAHERTLSAEVEKMSKQLEAGKAELRGLSQGIPKGASLGADEVAKLRQELALLDAQSQQKRRTIEEIARGMEVASPGMTSAMQLTTQSAEPSGKAGALLKSDPKAGVLPESDTAFADGTWFITPGRAPYMHVA